MTCSAWSWQRWGHNDRLHPWRCWPEEDLHSSWRHHAISVQEQAKDITNLESADRRAWIENRCGSFRQNTEHTCTRWAINRRDWQVHRFLIYLNASWLCCHEWAEWFKDKGSLNWVYTFCLENTRSCFALHIQWERSGYDVTLHCRVP